jgi:hypothetical protein
VASPSWTQVHSPKRSRSAISYAAGRESTRKLLPQDVAERIALSVKVSGSLAYMIKLRRSSTFQIVAGDQSDVKPPRKNWLQTFQKRYPELKATRTKAIDQQRHDHNIYDKVVHWVTVIGKELANPAVLPENTYNMDKIGVLLSVSSSLKVLARDVLLSQEPRSPGPLGILGSFRVLRPHGHVFVTASQCAEIYPHKPLYHTMRRNATSRHSEESGTASRSLVANTSPTL